MPAGTLLGRTGTRTTPFWGVIVTTRTLMSFRRPGYRWSEGDIDAMDDWYIYDGTTHVLTQEPHLRDS